MTVLVTGATGFIGCHLVNALLEAGGEVKGLSRRSGGQVERLWPQGQPKWIFADLGEASSLNGACTGIRTVFHLAGYAHAEDADDERSAAAHRRVTIDGTRSLLAEAVRSGVKRFIFASSVKAMGEGGVSCLDELSPSMPSSAYGKAKLEAEGLVLAAGRAHGIRTCVIRFPLVYGRGNKGNIPRMIAAIDRGRFPPLPKIENKRSMIHVRDAVQALLLASERPEASGKFYIATDGGVHSTREIFESIYAALKKPIPRWTVPAAVFRCGAIVGDILSRITGQRFPLNGDVVDKLFGSAWYSNEKIRCELEFEPRYSFEDALPEMVEECRKR